MKHEGAVENESEWPVARRLRARVGSALELDHQGGWEHRTRHCRLVPGLIFRAAMIYATIAGLEKDEPTDEDC
jgi:hypothetical protein